MIGDPAPSSQLGGLFVPPDLMERMRLLDERLDRVERGGVDLDRLPMDQISAWLLNQPPTRPTAAPGTTAFTGVDKPPQGWFYRTTNTAGLANAAFVAVAWEKDNDLTYRMDWSGSGATDIYIRDSGYYFYSCCFVYAANAVGSRGILPELISGRGAVLVDFLNAQRLQTDAVAGEDTIITTAGITRVVGGQNFSGWNFRFLGFQTSGGLLAIQNASGGFGTRTECRIMWMGNMNLLTRNQGLM